VVEAAIAAILEAMTFVLPPSKANDIYLYNSVPEQLQGLDILGQFKYHEREKCPYFVHYEMEREFEDD